MLWDTSMQGFLTQQALCRQPFYLFCAFEVLLLTKYLFVPIVFFLASNPWIPFCKLAKSIFWEVSCETVSLKLVLLTLQIRLLVYNFTKEFDPIWILRNLFIFLEYLFYRTPVFQVPKNMQIYCKNRLKSTQMMKNIYTNVKRIRMSKKVKSTQT